MPYSFYSHTLWLEYNNFIIWYWTFYIVSKLHIQWSLLYFDIQVALLVGSSFPLFIMLLELMPRWYTLSRPLFLLFRILFFFYLDLMRYADLQEMSLFSKKIYYDFINMYGGFKGPSIGPHDAERRQSLGQLYVWLLLFFQIWWSADGKLSSCDFFSSKTRGREESLIFIKCFWNVFDFPRGTRLSYWICKKICLILNTVIYFTIMKFYLTNEIEIIQVLMQ